MAKTTISTSEIGIPTAKEIKEKVNAQRQGHLDARVKEELEDFKMELHKALEEFEHDDNYCEVIFNEFHPETVRLIEEELGYDTRSTLDTKYNLRKTVVVIFQ